MNWKQRSLLEKRLRAVEHTETCTKEHCSTCSRMLTQEKLAALARDTRRLLAEYDAVSGELKERTTNASGPLTKENMRARADAFIAEMAIVFPERSAIDSLEYGLRWFWRTDKKDEKPTGCPDKIDS